MVVRKTPIKCQHCGAYVTDSENLSNYVIPSGGVTCPSCGRVVIPCPGDFINWKTESKTSLKGGQYETKSW